MNPWTRACIGALGGFAAWLSKLLALDAATLNQFVEQQLWLQAADLKVSVFIILPVLVFLGAVIAWLTEESLRIKLFAIGVSAPAIIAPWTAKSTMNDIALLESIALVQPAYAQTKDARQQGVVDGLKVLLGITEIPDPKEERYWVIVGAFSDLDQAYLLANEINRAHPDLAAFVGSRMPGNPLFPVIVGGKDGYMTLANAQKLQQHVNDLGLSKGGAYLSAYAERVPEDGNPR